MERKSLKYLVVFFLIAVSVFLSSRNGLPNTLSWDGMGYNAYYNILFDGADDLPYFEEIKNKYDNTEYLYQFNKTDSTFYVKYTIGWAVMYSPFIASGHLIAHFTSHEKDFFSPPYQWMVLLGTFFFLFGAWINTWKSLLFYFNQNTTLIAIVFAALGTSYFYYSYDGLGMNHHVQFYLVSVLVLNSIRLVNHQKTKTFLILGIVLGLIGLVRLPDLVLGIFPLIMLIGKKQLNASFFRKNYTSIIFSFLCFVGIVSLQLLYWKWSTGSWWVNSYENNAGEGLDLFSTNILYFLWDYKSGLFPYFPAYLLAFLGCFFAVLRSKSVGTSILITLMIFTYIVGSWSAYWYAPRAVLEAMPLWAFGFAFFINPSNLKKFSFVLIPLLLLFNVFKSWQISKSITPQLQMTREAYWKTFFNTTPLSGVDTLMLRPMNENFNTKEFENWKNKYIPIESKTISYEPFVILHSKNQFIEEIVVTQNVLKSSNDLMVSTEVQFVNEQTIPAELMIYLYIKHDKQVYHWRSIDMNHAKVELLSDRMKWHHYLPIPRSKSDTYHIGMWLNSSSETEQVKIEEIKITFFSRDGG